MRSRGNAPSGKRTAAETRLPQRTVSDAKPAGPESRERLLSAASHYFLNGSYHGVGIAEICSAASVQKGTFYHFFPSKTDLLLAAIERRVCEIDAAIGAISASKMSAARKITQLFVLNQLAPADPAKETPRDNLPPGYFLANIVLELASSNPPVQAAAKDAFTRWTHSIEAIVAQLIAEESLQNLDTHDAAEAVLGLLQGGAVMAGAYSDPRKMRAFANIALTTLRASGSHA
jgi:TetR/AcrR family transcriptional regulator, transcriptional repressor for nem operon